MMMWKKMQLLAVSLTITSIARFTVTASPILNDSDHSIVKSSRTFIVSSSRIVHEDDDDDDDYSPTAPVTSSAAADSVTAATTISSTTSKYKGIGCASPEVLVNGSPSPDILETVNGGAGSSSSSASPGIGNIQEIQFVGASVAVAAGEGAAGGGDGNAILSGRERRRICKIKCLNGVWVGPLCIIESAECPSITSGDVNLRISSDGNKVHDEARFSCLDGYRLKGAQEVICTSSGSWSHPVPECEAIQCPEIQSNDPNLQIWNQDRNFSSTASFSCPDGFNLQGAASVTCNSTGSWSNPVPYCEVSTCQPPIPPSNGRLLQGSGHFKAGDYVEFSCDPGFQLMGSSSSLSVCLENGSWSQSVPQCKRVCPFPGEPDNGYIQPTKFHYDVSDGISIICKQDYEANGPAFIYCTSAGTWSSPLTTCQKYSSRPDLDDIIF